MENKKILVYSANISPIKCKHYWGCYLELFYEEPFYKIQLTDTYAKDRYNDAEIKTTATLPNEFPDMSIQELKIFIEKMNCLGPNQGGETPYRELTDLEIELVLQAAKNK